MSDRKLEDVISELPLAVRHEMQIEALTKPGLTDEERVEAFSETAGFSVLDKKEALEYLHSDYFNFGLRRARLSPAGSVWKFGQYQASLFGNLPGCKCPVTEAYNISYYTHRITDEFKEIPTRICPDWEPTVETLRRFAEVQQGRRK